MQQALLAGTFVALACGLAGYFLVLRAQVFAGDALSHVAFTGALAALAVGIDARLGVFVATIAVGMALAGMSKRGQADDVAIGTVFVWILGIGVLCLSLFTTNRSTSNGAAAIRVLFGSIFGLSRDATILVVVVGLALAALLLAIARPLLFASLDPDVAASRGIPGRLVGVAFLALLGACAAEATQAVGALLLLGLLAAPAGAAQRLTTRPFAGLALSAAIAVGSVWLGLWLAYAIPKLPPSFTIILVASAVYGLACLPRPVRSSAALPVTAPAG